MQRQEKLRLHLILRRKVRMAALGRHDIPLIAAPDHHRFAEAGARADDGDRFAGATLAGMQGKTIGLGE